MASIKIDQQAAQANPPSIQPEETYHASFHSTAPIRLRIATGGAGQSGLVRALAEGFINHLSKTEQCQPFGISWLKSDTTASFNYLGENAADVSITYHAAAEEIAIKQGIADRREYAWRDHWLLVGTYPDPPKPLSLSLHLFIHQCIKRIVHISKSVSKVPKPTPQTFPS